MLRAVSRGHELDLDCVSTGLAGTKRSENGVIECGAPHTQKSDKSDRSLLLEDPASNFPCEKSMEDRSNYHTTAPGQVRSTPFGPGC